MAEKTKQTTGGRLAALDGLRGIAAVVVLLHHAMYTNPDFPGAPGTGSAPTGSAMWWISYTPLKLATAGVESVIVFFVLSGLVVTLPVIRHRGFDWFAYFPRRAVRLLVPVMASVVLAAVWVMAIPQVSTQPKGTWLSSSSTPNFSWEYIVKAWDLLGGDGQINNPLWSLRWELLFSLALPIFAVAALAVRKWWMGGLAAACALTYLGVHADSGALQYLPAFFVGAVIAVRLEAVRNVADRINTHWYRHPLWAGLTVASLLLLIAPWLVGPNVGEIPELEPVLKGLVPLAAAGLVVAALGWKPLRAVLDTRPVQFTGTISFSLYLVHVPILIFSTYLFADEPWYVPLLFGIPVAVLVAVGFTWLIEKRSHGWSKAVGNWASDRYRTWFGRDEEAEERRSGDQGEATGGGRAVEAGSARSARR
ncbi:Peptidoglycan/LPS O-acetylase OafA/YrhL, contains acyltransferase and SGNH-hydrolase domains [Leifsonia sp. 98AMF]|uniref:acyltransferase family protein n=1 Tax=unclassified Leifsonia TaxID=2663824 RepID=UPI0008796FBB|nr:MULTISPECIES: acyltransferase [unclassified Leifsonia]SDH18408.1 Peptidoglycan/LPS O-acetylase OafA/YrhL, contains acyltransferase and SGNH-hydrolase domains [Leifsonia sp. 197AMF]SDJ20107.1 Peptidoglycan/LPS O-acetylase OafA/YrhL, contains acyltransferase and SGNH-hydrolase domains [Leifsonia sp. 466MF]SDJ45624.1 Peptidoglycan/LPS O-acetylase OafA/YrhL, contains acyltransferase and SGNH-hydrolase domains [Leifsonia sp. 157MF]SDN41520.1 Peptidoglycan/LPS O-acetylase OafA/YrhL, contains acylt